MVILPCSVSSYRMIAQKYKQRNWAGLLLEYILPPCLQIWVLSWWLWRAGLMHFQRSCKGC
ncbi:hypothetical protein BJY04DRAFT_184003 [Aspergillus karnatakaensis]|uniref:uncharacterized protein n=1 Tax=Aspergillus karnatakaensis TaxID=1810916 RepID=UPI003CCE2282